MKKIIFGLILFAIILSAGFFLLNIEVTTRQGINYEVRTLKIPLYLKVLDFYDRHYNYKWLVNNLIKDKTGDEEKVMAIFKWTIENIARQPDELRTVDDHVWHIIVRRYGTHDQFSDVFTTLCNYAGIDAFFFRLFTKDKTSQIPFSLVKLHKRWCVFDPYNGTFFVNDKGDFASVEDIAKGDWGEKNFGNLKRPNLRYSDYFNEILSIDFESAHKLSRANIQSPINRLIYGVRKR